MVNEEKQIFHCFGCASGGDLFTFLMKIDGLTFPEALKELALKAGVKLPENSRKTLDADQAEAKQKEWGFRLNALASDFFIANLWDSKKGEKGRMYLKKRGIDVETAKSLGLGLSLNDWEGLVNFLKEKKAPLTLAAELGLIKAREQKSGTYDFFRDRLIFPIRDLKGEVVAFGGRTLSSEADQAKYLNSPESLLYHKSSILYGYSWAKESIRKEDEAIIVEGNIDVVTLWQHGIRNVVAPCGTALTPDHLRSLSRITQNFIVAFDGDAAGIQAAWRSLPFFLELGLTPKAIFLPTGLDPDTFIRQEGADSFKKLAEKALTLFEALIDWISQNKKSGTSETIKVIQKLTPLLGLVQNPVERKIYLSRTGLRLGIPEEDIEKSIKNPNKINKISHHPSSTQKYPEEEKLLLATLVLNPSRLATLQEKEALFTHPLLKTIATQLFLNPAEEWLERLKTTEEQSKELASWIRELALREEEDPRWEKTTEDCLARIRLRKIKLELTRLNAEIASAESEGNEKILLKLLAEKGRLTEEKKRTPHETNR